MAGKFKIFCDEISTFEPADKPMVVSQQQPQSQPQATGNGESQQQQQLNQTNPAKLSATNADNSNSNNNEQEKFSALAQLSSVTAGNASQQPFKREPLGLRQALSQTMAAAPAQAGLEAPPTASSLTGSSSLSTNDEDQENDISMASLGSDFVPSILHHADDYHKEDDDNQYDEDHSFEYEDDDYGGMLNYDDQDDCSITDDFQCEDFEDDEELKTELRQAFKQHDDSQLFKSTVYIDDIATYLLELERVPELRPLPDYMDFQNDIDSSKRSILINWLIEVSDDYELQPETVFICISIIDRFLSQMVIQTCNFQLLGVAAMFIASKYEEIYPPDLHKFVEVTDDTYSGKQIILMEQQILKTLNFRISSPTISFFLKQIFAFNKFSKKVYHLAEYLCYLSLVSDKPILEYYPSEIALAAVILAAHQLNASSSISPELQSSYDESISSQLCRRNLPESTDRRVKIVNQELPLSIEALWTLQECAFSRSSKQSTDAVVVQKFSTEAHNCVALLVPPKKEELINYFA